MEGSSENIAGRYALKKVNLKNVKIKPEMHCAQALHTDGMYSDGEIRELLMKKL